MTQQLMQEVAHQHLFNQFWLSVFFVIPIVLVARAVVAGTRYSAILIIVIFGLTMGALMVATGVSVPGLTDFPMLGMIAQTTIVALAASFFVGGQELRRILGGETPETDRSVVYSTEQVFFGTGRTQVARALDWQPDLLVHLVHATPEDLHAVARAGVTAVSCPRCNGVLGNGFPDLAAWRAAGVRLALGTDNVMFVAPDMLRELDFASRLGRGLAADPRALDARELLQAATLNGARGLKLDADLGSLAPGKEASFLLFDLDRPHLRYQHDPISAIVHRAGRADIAAIYVRGQLVGY